MFNLRCTFLEGHVVQIPRMERRQCERLRLARLQKTIMPLASLNLKLCTIVVEANYGFAYQHVHAPWEFELEAG